MAWIRKLPSGLWAATVRLPTGKKITESYDLKKAATSWASEQESSLARGDWIDPRLGKITVGEWRERSAGARRLERASRLRDESHWRCHVEPYWAKVPVGSILQPDVQIWINKMEKAGAGPDTVIGSAKVLRGLLELAVAGKVLRYNPAKGVSLPEVRRSPYRVLEPKEDVVLLDAFRKRFGDRPECAMFVELLLDTGIRWEEAAGMSRARVNITKQRVHIIDVMERDHTVRHYPKSAAGVREVPIGDKLWSRFKDHVLSRPEGGLIFTTQRGLPLDYTRWRARVWAPVLSVPVEFGGRNHLKVLKSKPLLDGVQPTPHDCRHTFATRMAEQGMPQHELMALLGHVDPRAVQGYLHAGEARFDRARKANDRARRVPGSQAAHDLGEDEDMAS